MHFPLTPRIIILFLALFQQVVLNNHLRIDGYLPLRGCFLYLFSCFPNRNFRTMHKFPVLVICLTPILVSKFGWVHYHDKPLIAKPFEGVAARQTTSKCGICMVEGASLHPKHFSENTLRCLPWRLQARRIFGWTLSGKASAYWSPGQAS